MLRTGQGLLKQVSQLCAHTAIHTLRGGPSESASLSRTSSSMGRVYIYRELCHSLKPARLMVQGRLLLIDRGTLLSLKSGTFDTTGATNLKANILYLEVFRNDDATRVLSPPLHDTGSWKKAIGERLKYDALELRKNVEKAVGINDKLWDHHRHSPHEF